MKNKLQAFVWVMSRMTTAIYGLLLIALASVAGTLLVQGESAVNYDMRFGEFWSGVFQLSGLTNLYSSWWFLVCCFFIVLSVGACLISSGRLILRKLLRKQPVPKNIPKHLKEISVHEAVAGQVERYAKLTFAERGESESGFKVYRLGRLNRVGYFVLHISILGVVASGFVSGVFGYRGIVNLKENNGSAEIIVPRDGKMHFETLPFTIVNRGFRVDYYASGLPKFYETKLDIIKEEQVLERTVQVNHPVSVGAYTLYQSDFGDAGSKVKGVVKHLKRNKNNNFSGEIYAIYENKGASIEITNASQHVSSQVMPEGGSVPQMRSDGAAVDYIITRPTKMPLSLRSFTNQPNVIGIEVATGVFRPMLLGLSLDDEKGWDVVAAVLAGSKSGGMGAEPISPQEFSALADAAVKAYPEDERLDIALKALQAVRVLQQFDLDILLHVKSIEPKLFSGIQVSYDPAVHAFWLFSVLLLLGVVLMIYFPYGTVYCVDYKTHALLFVDAGRYTGRITAWVLNLDASHNR